MSRVGWLEVGYGLDVYGAEVAIQWTVVGHCAHGHPMYLDPHDNTHAVDLGCDAELRLSVPREHVEYTKHGDVLTFKFHVSGWSQEQIHAFVNEVLAQAEASDDHPEALLAHQEKP